MNALMEFAHDLNDKGELTSKESRLLAMGERLPLSTIQLHWLEKQLKKRGYTIPTNGVRKKGKERQKVKLIKGLPDELYDFQKEGVSFIERKGGKCLVGDEMGLGKTVEALSYLELHPELRPAVVVCPGCVKYNWQKEIWRWTEDDIEVLEGRQGINLKQKEDIIYVVNYEILRNAREKVLAGVDVDGNKVYRRQVKKKSGWVDFLLALNPRAVVIDECHRLSNYKSDQTQDVIKLCRKAQSVVGLSGTPIRNRVTDIFTFVNLIEPRLFTSRMNFRKRYAGAYHNGFGWTDGNGTHLQELNKKLRSTIMLRRTKAEVLKEMPVSRRAIVPIQIDKKHSYWKAEKDFVKWFKSTGASADQMDSALKAETLVRLGKLKQLVIDAKMPGSIEWIENFIDNEEKLVCFTRHKAPLKVLRERFTDKCVVVDGSCTSKQKYTAMEEFQTDPDKILFFGNLQSAGEGITLTAASNTLTLELDWFPGSHLQAEKRIDRIGQDQACTNYYLVAHGTIEEDFVMILNEKMDMFSQAIDGMDAGTHLLSDYLRVM